MTRQEENYCEKCKRLYLFPLELNICSSCRLKAERQRLKEEIEDKKNSPMDEGNPQFAFGYETALEEVLALLEEKK